MQRVLRPWAILHEASGLDAGSTFKTCIFAPQVSNPKPPNVHPATFKLKMMSKTLTANKHKDFLLQRFFALLQHVKPVWATAICKNHDWITATMVSSHVLHGNKFSHIYIQGYTCKRACFWGTPILPEKNQAAAVPNQAIDAPSLTARRTCFFKHRVKKNTLRHMISRQRNPENAWCKLQNTCHVTPARRTR